jgi:hypothetical protein
MNKTRLNCCLLAATCAALAITFIPGSVTPSATGAARPVASADADLNAESRAVDSFLNDLRTFNKKWVELGAKSTVTRTEFDPVQRNADDLKRRLSDIQNAARDAVKKLKASGQWDAIDAIVLSRITSAKLQSQFRQNSFKQIIEEAASQLTVDANEISKPLDVLRAKVSANAQEPGFGEYPLGPAVRTVRAAYYPPVTKLSLTCRLAMLNVGLSGFIHKKPTDTALEAVDCACTNQNCFVW